MHEALLVVHILGAAMWIGGGIATVVSRRQMVTAGGAIATRWMQTEARLGKTYFPTAAVVTVLAGIGLVLTGDDVGFADAFVIIGILAWLFSAIGNSVYAAKKDEKVTSAFESGDERQANRLIATTTRFHMADNALLIIALIAMVYRIGA